MKDVTRDSISLRGAGIVQITQPKKGHRFTLDSILLADFCRIKPDERVLEPGAGTGIISILLARKIPKATFFAVEVQPDAARLCRQNVLKNELDDHVIVLERDIRQLPPSVLPKTFEAIVANPPYTKLGTGRKSPGPERQTARQDQSAGLEAWLDLHYSLKNKGRYFIVFPANRVAELTSLMRSRKLEPKRARFVHPYHDKPAALVLIEAVKSAGVGLEVMPPLIVHEQGGGYTEEMREIYGL